MRREDTLKDSWLHLLLLDQMLDHEFTAQQAAWIVRDLPQPLLEGELLFGLRLHCVAARRFTGIPLLGTASRARSGRGLLVPAARLLSCGLLLSRRLLLSRCLLLRSVRRRRVGLALVTGFGLGR
jgi:hypothetical protein